jgi:glycosyltransferase involved in cell wall biosynthesis
MLMTFLFLGAAALFVLGALAALWHLRWLHRLPSLEHLSADGASVAWSPMRCSVIVAARDEEARIEQTVRRLLAQRGVELELIVVDDRSADRTGEILEQLAKEDSRLRVVRVDTVPKGWLGKCHACHLGASAAKGEWLLFTDADCWSKPDVLIRAVRVAELERADHVTLTPGRTTSDLGVRATALLFHLSCVNLISGVNRDRPKSHLGLGAFNLVRATAYRQCGGYEALRLTVLDDVKLGLLLQRAGKRTRAFLGADDLEAHWGTSLWDVIPLMEKNYFAALDFSLPLALGIGAFLTI